MNKYVTIFILIGIGYLIGAKFPVFAAKLGLA